MKPKTFKNGEEFARYIERVTGKPFKAMASTDATTAHKYLSGQHAMRRRTFAIAKDPE